MKKPHIHSLPLVRVCQSDIIKLRPTSLNICTGYLPFMAPGELKGAAILRIWLPCAIQTCGTQALAVPFSYYRDSGYNNYDPRPQLTRRHTSGVLQKESNSTRENKNSGAVTETSINSSRSIFDFTYYPEYLGSFYRWRSSFAFDKIQSHITRNNRRADSETADSEKDNRSGGFKNSCVRNSVLLHFHPRSAVFATTIQNHSF